MSFDEIEFEDVLWQVALFEVCVRVVLICE